MRRITLHKSEDFSAPPFFIIRLRSTGAGAGSSTAGEYCELLLHHQTVAEKARVVSTRDIELGDLTEQDAQDLASQGDNSLSELRTRLAGLYRTRPQWDGDRTEFRIIEIDY